MTWTVHKFGGTSVADASCIRRVADIIGGEKRGNLGVVVSAMKGVTDDLLGLIEKAVRREPVEPTLKALRARHEKACVELLGAAGAKPVLAEFDRELADIESILKALSLVRAASHRSRDLVSGFGEIWSARQIAAFFKKEFGKTRDVMFVNARDVLVIEQSEMGPVVAWDASRPKLAAAIPSGFSGVAVITGFVASDRDGLPTTLGRNGSDYSASIFGALLDADEVHIWTDVDGVMSGDPRRVPEAKIIDEMSYSEAMELAYFGAKVIHPQTMAPAVGRGIPIWIRNTFNPTHPGTKISATSGHRGAAVKGISGVDGVALVNLEGAGMIGVPGTADRLFGALREAGVSVMLISQGSSEHSICFAVRDDVAENVRKVVERAFAVELNEGQVQRVGVTRNCAIVAVVGDDMAGMPGSAGRFFGTLGQAGINVRAIAQGSSERNISAVIDAKDVTRAIRAVHSSFYLSAKTVSIGVLGPGLVGGTLLDQIASALPQLREKFNLDLRVRAIGSSKKMLLDEQRIDLKQWRDALKKGVAMDTDKLIDHVQADYLPHSVIIDCSASQAVADRYAEWLKRGIHVITPNKRAHSGPMTYYQDLKRLSRGARTHFLYEATVGAGLPVIQTLKDLVETGDEIRSISGIFSGTLAYLFNVFDGTKPFSEIVRDAKARGYTEPDPRDDLSGTDVARKAVILAREAGLSLELTDIAVESLVPAALAKASVDEFMKRLPDFDAPMAERVAAAKKQGKVLRYVANIDVGAKTAKVGLEAFAPSHPFANISLTDNIVQFVTGRYCDNPLIVRGPGAGPAVTAGGIFADLLRLCSMLSGNQD
ncbi:MAG TPA: bifunctional aspartate kinase/homoserine dehydrogenase I [Gammaproteobacteria bacterium]|nr:bifunctional aspartate kinase/homoserine dehydrogenase I [Gammaproteobacteria bacterium]